MPDEKEERPAYDVGYKKPPKATQFQKGTSGNPSGKPAGRRNVKTLLMAELRRRVSVSKDGRTRRMAMSDIIVRRWVDDAARGDAKAREQLLRLLGQVEASEEASNTTTVDREHDREILARFRARLAAEITGGEDA